jgi:hypothetical protein
MDSGSENWNLPNWPSGVIQDASLPSLPPNPLDEDSMFAAYIDWDNGAADQRTTFDDYNFLTLSPQQQPQNGAFRFHEGDSAASSSAALRSSHTNQPRLYTSQKVGQVAYRPLKPKYITNAEPLPCHAHNSSSNPCKRHITDANSLSSSTGMAMGRWLTSSGPPKRQRRVTPSCLVCRYVRKKVSLRV